MAIAEYILTLSCANRPGIVSVVSTAIARHGGDIVQAAQFDDTQTQRFFMRVRFRLAGDPAPLRADISALAEWIGSDWRLRSAQERCKVLVMVSKFDHCLQDLLYRARIGELAIDCVGIVSNHPVDALAIAPDPSIPFHHLPITPATKHSQEARIDEVIARSGAQLVVLARYMQILSDSLASALSGRCINIHHSFLPGFKGAKPYHQAFERGVKMIGATAHYVTSDLDEGPIITQDVEQVSHADTPDDMVRKGRDIERRVLARAVALHIEDRVLLNGRKTVVFS